MWTIIINLAQDFDRSMKDESRLMLMTPWKMLMRNLVVVEQVLLLMVRILLLLLTTNTVIREATLNFVSSASSP